MPFGFAAYLTLYYSIVNIFMYPTMDRRKTIESQQVQKIEQKKF